MNFTDIEVYQNANPRYGYAPTLLSWHLRSEPGVFVIDHRSIIHARFDGPTSDPEIVAAGTASFRNDSILSLLIMLYGRQHGNDRPVHLDRERMAIKCHHTVVLSTVNATNPTKKRAVAIAVSGTSCASASSSSVTR